MPRKARAVEPPQSIRVTVSVHSDLHESLLKNVSCINEKRDQQFADYGTHKIKTSEAIAALIWWASQDQSWLERIIGQFEDTEYARRKNPPDAPIPDVAEIKAVMLGESPVALEKRLHHYLRQSRFPHRYANRFFSPTFQFEQKRLLSDDGMLALRWKIRANPRLPIAPRNPQFPRGIVELMVLIDEEDLRRAQYIGPGIDLNDPDGEYQVDPLLTGENGSAYKDDRNQWRFKRDDGTIGFCVARNDLKFRRRKIA